MNLRATHFRTTSGLAVAIVIASGIGAPAAAQGLLDRARSLFGGDAEQATADSDREVALTNDEIGAGLREALQVAVGTVVEQLGSPDGFNNDPAVHIPLPESLEGVQSVLERAGFGEQLENLEFRMNLAAETAVGRTRELLVSAITEMTLEGVIDIYRGADDAATQYFRAQMSEALAADMRPVVDQSLQDVGAARALENVVDRYNALPFSREVDSDLTGYVVDKGLDGIFYYLAEEEAAIRQDPVKRSSELLQRLFGNE